MPAYRTRRSWWRRCRSRFLFGAGLREREQDGEARPVAPRVDVHEATVGLDGAVHDGQSETAAAALGGEEWVEHALAKVGRDSRPVVDDAQRSGPRLEAAPRGELV